MKTRKAIGAAALAAAVAAQGWAVDFDGELTKAQRVNRAVAETWGQGERALRVDAAAGEVVALAEFCSIDVATTIEFPIVGELSDRGYEALFRTFARPGALAAALEALGLPRGGGTDGATFDFWPRGERVEIDVAPLADTNAVWTPIQRYVIDLTTRAPLAFESFVYCGSRDDADVPGSRVCDTVAPNAVLSTYNEPQTVLDMPARLNQNDVYGRFVLAPDHGLAPDGLYRLRFRAAPRPDGLPRVRDCALTIEKGTNGMEYALAEAGHPVRRFAGADALATAVGEIAGGGFDLFAAITFDGNLTVAEAAAAAKALVALEGEKGFRAKGPGADAIYYRGFLPDEAWRVRKDRPSQPWEMRLAAVDGGTTKATLVKTIEDWTSTDSLDPILTTQEFPVATPAEAAALMAGEGDGLPVLLVFAPAQMRLSQVMPFVLALKPTHHTVYIFSE